MSLLVDSTVWIDYFNGVSSPETDFLHQVLAEPGSVLLGDLILAEVLQGFRTERDYVAARHGLLSLPIVELVGAEVALASAENFRALRGLGITVRKTIDCLIATHCILERLPLLHADRDFEPFEVHLGLRVARPERG